jgi:hypothetical protein
MFAVTNQIATPRNKQASKWSYQVGTKQASLSEKLTYNFKISHPTAQSSEKCSACPFAEWTTCVILSISSATVLQLKFKLNILLLLFSPGKSHKTFFQSSSIFLA